MSAAVAIVTDSTAYLPAGLADRHGVRVVPLQVAVDGAVTEESPDEDTDDAAAGLVDALRRGRPVSTSRPSPGRFAQTYAAAAAAGATGVVSVHLSAAMSGTVEAARLAARDATVPVRVVDSGTIGMGIGFAALSAAAAADRGEPLDDVAAAALRRAEGSRSLFYVDTLDHLRSGGRVDAAAALLGSALMVKPLLGIADGRITPLEKVRTVSRALARMEDLAVGFAAGREVDVAVQHLSARERADAFAARLRERLPRIGDLYVGQVGPVIGAHAGPGMLAVVVAPR